MKPDIETKEVFLPARVLDACLKGWEEADDMVLSRAVGEAMEHAYWHWRWVMAVRQFRCRLVVVQVRDARGVEMMPHYQIGELFTLSGWHPERALAEAQTLLAESGDGLSFDLPVDHEMIAEWTQIAKVFDIDEDNVLELLGSAMVLLDQAHDKYVEELGENFYVATRGLERELDNLIADEYGRWSAETMQIVDKTSTMGMAQVFPEVPEGMTSAVPLVYLPDIIEESQDEDDEEHGHA
ncbi:MAG: hypothetical protein DI585_05200 [Pseudomonas fluorescens]|nr:MAG: hypothetical protein DI585_05200 [Pseudomonas fluorescens]